MPGLQVHHRRTDPRAVLHGGLHALRKRSPRDVPAGPALAGVSLGLGDFQGCGAGRSNTCRRCGEPTVSLSVSSAAPGALRRPVGLDVVRMLGLKQRCARMTGLAARAAARQPPLAARPLLLGSLLGDRRLG